MARRGSYFLLNKKEDFARGSGVGIVVDAQGIALADGCAAGVYDTRIFDCGERGMQWHRLMMYGNGLSGNVSVTVRASDEEGAAATERAEKTEFSDAEDVLLTGVRGRYVSLRIRLESRDKAETRISRIKLCFLHQTWLSYLPEIYREYVQEDSFFARYLGIFQSLYEDMTEQIMRVPQRFSPFTEDGAALGEISEWFGLNDRELWNEDQRRYLLLHAARLLRIRGTAEYLKELLFLGTGRKVCIVEYGQLLPYFDGGETEERLKRLYTSGPCEFAVVAKQKEQAEENALYVIGKIVELAKPAYMACRIVVPPPYLFLGQHSYLGINSVLSRYRTLCLDGKCAMPFSIIAGEEED